MSEKSCSFAGRLGTQTSHTAAQLPQVLYCSDEDFKTLVILADKLVRHLIDFAYMLPEPKTTFPVIRYERRDLKENMETLFASLPKKFTKKDAIEIGIHMGLESRTVENYIRRMIDKKDIMRIDRGKYQKID